MGDYALLIIFAFLIVLLGIYSYVQNSKYKLMIVNRIKDSYGKPANRKYADGEYAHVGGYAGRHKKDYSIDDITWNDLNMDAIFGKLNYTYSSAGEEYLYYLFRNPSLEDKGFEYLEKNINLLMDDENERNKLALMLHKCGRTGKYSIYDYISNLETIENEKATTDILIDLLYLVVAILFFINVGYALAALGVVLVISGLTYFSKKRRIEPYIICFNYIFKVLNGIKAFDKNDGCVIFANEKKRLKELGGEFASFRGLSGIVMNASGGDPLGIFIDYIKIFFHLDIIKFIQMKDELKKHSNDIDEILEIIGIMDSTLSIAMFRGYIGTYTVPVFGGEEYKANGLYHVLNKAPVANDICTRKGIILTGSNASGKSTMLKMMAVNAILAQSVHTVMAASYMAPMYRIYTSLAMNDNIFKGESYYMSEIKSLKRVIDAGMMESTPILACVDEVLRGTNTTERISASFAILRDLSKVDGIIAVATHDLELAVLLDGIYDNYHFEEEITGNDIKFNYKILPGIATTRNAIALLESVGYDSQIVSLAKRIAINHDRTGRYEE